MSAPVQTWLSEPLPRQVSQALARLSAAEDVQEIAVMPDVHLAHGVCIGTVVATSGLLFPAAIGGDVGCGVATMRFAGSAQPLGDRVLAARVLALLQRLIPVLKHPAGAGGEPPGELWDTALSLPALERLKNREGRVQFATIGRGNHFLELQVDPEGALWVMVHSGSRAIGPAVQRVHQRWTRAGRGGFAVIEADTARGQAYLADLRWAERYAEASRQGMLAAAAAVIHRCLGYAPELASIQDCGHNHVRQEQHGGRLLWVHRKGAIPAALDEPGLIPGSMGTPSFHVRGRGCARALCSSSHGAGRRLSRTAARQQVSVAELRRQLRGVHHETQGLARLVEEAPGAYKDIRAVMRAQRELTRVVRALRPVLSHKGS